jgi:protocatechuate 3,4-dioxygenase beta subunit
VDFGYRASLSLGDLIWNDLNGNGLRTANEPGIANVEVQLRGAGVDNVFNTADDFTRNTTTNANGIYTFTDLPAGQYQVRVNRNTLPVGLTAPSFDLDGIHTPHLVTLTLVANRTDVDFGYRTALAIGDIVWHDANGDGVQQNNNQHSEPGLAGVGVLLRGAGVDNAFNTSDDLLASTTTAADGRYSFADIGPGRYRISINTSTLPATIRTPTHDFDGTQAGSADVAEVTLVNAGNLNLDFGYRGTQTIGDRVWFDSDADGLQDPEEDGLSNVEIRLTSGGQDGLFSTTLDNLILTTTTSSLGNYTFSGLGDGLYRIEVLTNTLPEGLRTATFDFDGITSAHHATLNLTEGNSSTALDFGYSGSLSIGNRVWLDLDADGVMDSTEPGLGSVQVTLLSAGLDGVIPSSDDFELTTTTNASGQYIFNNLVPGLYRVSVNTQTLPSGVTIPTHDLDGEETPHTAESL